MAKIDELKEQLGILKSWLGIFVATFLAVIGWGITNYQKAELFILVGAGVVAVLALFAIYFLSKMINAKIKQIGKE